MGVERWNKDLRAATKRRSLVDDVSDLALSKFLDTKKKNLKKMSTYNGTPARRAHANRVARHLRTKYLNRLWRRQKRKRGILKNVNAILYSPKTDYLRDMLSPNFQMMWRPMQQRMRHKTVEQLSLREFSFAKNPNGTLRRLRELAEACALYPDLRLNFLDQDCDDVTPYVVLAHLTRALPPIISGGKITHQVSEVVDAVGMRGALRIGSIARTPDQKDYSVSAFKMLSRTPPGTFGDEDHLLRPQYKERVADQFCDTINSWLKNHELELIEEAESAFVRTIGEALDNAERHGDPEGMGNEGDWSIAAFSRLLFDQGAPLLRCSIGIVSVGATISDSLSSAAPSVANRIDEYVSRHTPLFRAKHQPETLRTIMALQDGITRVERATQSLRGGVGFMELIEVVSELGENGRDDLQSAFTIVSGNSCIRVTAPFRCGEPQKSGLRELWFNPGNDDMLAPSDEHVFSLEDHFPGVILSACFTIDPGYLRKKLDS